MKKFFHRSSVQNLASLLLILFLISCSGAPTENSPEQLKKQLEEYKTQATEINRKIAELEAELQETGNGNSSRNAISVGVSAIAPQNFSHYVMVNASLEAVNQANISPETNGQITKIRVKKGERVKAGQVVAYLNVSVIENSIRELETNLELAKSLYERQKNLWEKKIGSEVQYLQAKNNYESLQFRLNTLRSQLEMSVIKAPIDGIVDDIYVKEGELALPGLPMMLILNLSTLYVNADVSESFLPYVNTGDEVILRFPAFPEFEQEMKIHRIGHVINPENRTFRLQLLLANINERYKPNMVASISFKTFSGENSVVVPSIYIKQDIQGHYVFVAKENGNGQFKARKAYVERGMESEGNTLIKSGLIIGDLLITLGHNQVSEGIPVVIGNEAALSNSSN